MCSFARKDKIWTRDPDGNFWEVYWVEEEVDPVVVRRSLEGVVAQATTPIAAPRIWEHSLVNADAIPAPYADASLDEVWLTGTFNAGSDAAHIDAVLAEAKRVLKPAGKVTVHGLISDAPLTTQPKLPGLASMVSFVPARIVVYEQLAKAGFVNLHATKLTEKPWFTHETIGLREMKFAAWKQPDAAGEADRMVLYKGPFAQVWIEGARVFRRGERTTVPASVWRQLRHGPSAEQFLFFRPAKPRAEEPRTQ
ncbi:MAG: methyltransferase domain-containing protein [Gemmataceae bacterium]